MTQVINGKELGDGRNVALPFSRGQILDCFEQGGFRLGQRSQVRPSMSSAVSECMRT
jgi:hypothetical protein